MKIYATFLLIGIALMILLTNKAYCQSLFDEIDVIIKNDFENNTLGTYMREEWRHDWLYPEWNIRVADSQIVQDVTDIVNPTKVYQMNYPEKSLGPNQGGAYWHTPLPAKYDEIYVSYDLMFMPGFKFQLGGKLPSVQGGTITALEKTTGYDGFTGGLMFKQDGKIVFYIYYPDSSNPGGITVYWGQWYDEKFATANKIKIAANGIVSYARPGKWHNVTYRMVLNSVNATGQGNQDGILEAYFDGNLVTQISNICFRYTIDISIDTMRIYTFFGGNTDEWRNPIEEWLRIDNVLLYTFKEDVDVPRGHVLSPLDRTVRYWRNGSVCDPAAPTATGGCAPADLLVYKDGPERDGGKNEVELYGPGENDRWGFVAPPNSPYKAIYGKIPVTLKADLEGIFSITQVDVVLDGNSIWHYSRLPGAEELIIDTSRLPDGVHQLEMTLTDSRQRYLHKSVSFMVDYWQQLTDELLPPLDAGGWFGAIDRSKTSASSAGWSYAVGDSGNFFGDEERLARSAATSDYLVWDTPGLQAVKVIIFAKQPSVVDGIQLAVSAGNSAWKPLVYDTKVSPAPSATGWYRMELAGATPAGNGVDKLRLSVDASVPAEWLQIGEVTFEVYHLARPTQ